ncbi:MAG TPA: hypothetical protein VMA73_23945, partial [Streptosporangiaceae bacterium]|nr:hypothetical protein [Streptosporangiaceae bacterium]
MDFDTTWPVVRLAPSIYADTLTLPAVEPEAEYESPPHREPFVRRHAVFLAVLSVALVARVITMVAYFPAQWWPDSFGYLGGTVLNGYLQAPALAPYP